MPSRSRRPKSRKRKARSRRKPSSRRRSRLASASALSSDYEESFSESEEETEEEDEDEDSDNEGDKESERTDVRHAVRQPASQQPRQRRRRRRPNSSDEDFNFDLEKDSDDEVSADNGHFNSPSAPALRNNTRNAVSNKEFDVDIDDVRRHASRRTRVRHPKRRKQDSSDEDFEVTLDCEFENGTRPNESAFATRPITRAMEAGHDSGSLTEGFASEHLENQNVKDDFDLGRKFNSEAGESSLRMKRVRISEKGQAASTRKGKEKVLEGQEPTANLLTEDVAVASVEGGAAVTVCGICLSETLVADRGKLDCCDHFFCFGCIMEWAKVESRCPMCKQRFAVVSKAGSSVTKRTRTIRIPLRNQVYVPPEDDLPFEDPYGNVACMECLGTEDEGLLLLCDRCDSAAHTFCVGLGRSVPRGDWYCRDCQDLTGENSDSGSGAEELVLASDSEEEDEETLLRSIVSAESQPRRRRRRRLQQGAVSTSEPSSQPRRRQQGGRRRLWRRLVSSRGRTRRVAAAPQLSQSARAYLSTVTPELNPVSNPLEAPHSGSARTVPQQRRLQERIVALRNNWGRLQNGDVQFDSIRTGMTASRQTRESSNRTSAPASASCQTRESSERTSSPASAPVLSRSNGADQDSANCSLQGVQELKRAWQMMGEARNLCSITTSKVQPQRPVSSHYASPTHHHWNSKCSELPIDTAMRSLPVVSRNIDVTDTRAGVLFSQPPERGDASSKMEPKESLQVLLRRAKELSCSRVSTAKYGEEMKQDNPSHSSYAANADYGVSSCGTQESTWGKGAADSSVRERVQQTSPIKCKMLNSDMRSFGRTIDHITDKEEVLAKDANVAKSSLSHPTEGLKIHLTELVKKQTWPVYLAERLDKEQFKRIARAAVHSLLALFDTNNESRSFACSHHEGHGENPIVPCCTRCLDQHVEVAVTTAKDKIVPR